jgi:serine/threonine protein kinase/dipeptidyl aminopeptidase/acylaminoacyl peptidase
MDAGEAQPDPGRPLAIGDRLGPYEILSPLGAGGMGEVYRARDSRLRRDVAIKVLHRSLAKTPDHVERLAREARAAGSLNHPGIVAVYDIGTEDHRPYIVTELLEGESLRSRLARGPLPYRKAVEYAMHIAQALGAAHEKGIWHRDVKPGNIFVTSDGRVKLLDFGLVKLDAPRVRVGSEDSTADETKPGGVHGTLGYMSPEQLLGDPVDQRTDIFALGTVLYEMLTGVPAFRRATTSETTRAVLTEEPRDLLECNRTLSPAVVAIVHRCVEKGREERFQSARDLAFQLQQLLHQASPTAAPVRGRRWLVVAAALAALAASGSLLAWRVTRVRSSPTFEQISFHRARIGGARFVAGGGAVVYSESREGGRFEVWWLSGPESPEPRSLGHRGSDVLAARPGRIALAQGRRYLAGERFVGTLSEAPLGEGAPREIADGVEDADWDPAGRQFVVVRTLGASAETRLEYPIGQALVRVPGSIRNPRFAPQGDRIAYLEDPTGRGAGGRVTVCDLEGKAIPLTVDWPSAQGLAWSPRGDEIWFAAGESRSGRAIRAVDLRGRERVVLPVPGSVTLWDVSPDGRVLLTRDDERSVLVGVIPGESRERDLSWFDNAGLGDISEDGKWVLFADRFGLYARGTDGSSPKYLGLRDGFGDDFSPDGRSVLATTAGGRDLVILPFGPGEPVTLPNHGITNHRGAMWFPDGQRIVFAGSRAAQGGVRSYVQKVDGTAPQELTPENVWALSISPDGEWVATMGSGRGIVLWPTSPGPSPRPVPNTQPEDRPVSWTADGRSLWVFRRGEVPADVWRVDIASGHRELWKRLSPVDPTGVHSIYTFKVTRDGRSYFYSYKRVVSQLYLVKGLE